MLIHLCLSGAKVYQQTQLLLHAETVLPLDPVQHASKRNRGVSCTRTLLLLLLLLLPLPLLLFLHCCAPVCT